MIVLIIDDKCIAVDKLECYPPVARYVYGPNSILLWIQQMETRAWVTHIFNIHCSIQAIENTLQFISMFWLDAFLGAVIKEIFKSFVRKGFYHDGFPLEGLARSHFPAFQCNR